MEEQLRGLCRSAWPPEEPKELREPPRFLSDVEAYTRTKEPIYGEPEPTPPEVRPSRGAEVPSEQNLVARGFISSVAPMAEELVTVRPANACLGSLFLYIRD